MFVDLQSEYPANPIEDPQSWAWGQHPDRGLGYKARDNLEVEVCLANPDYINTAIHGQYDTDFPELTSKFEKFSIGSSNNNSALF